MNIEQEIVTQHTLTRGTNRDREWKALYVASRHEKKVHAGILKKGLESYIPLKKTLKQWSDRKKWVEEPLIKGYVFVHVNSKERDMVFGVQGIVNYLRYQGKDAIVRDEEIEALKRLVALGYTIEAEPLNEVRKGMTVKIMDGPLKGVTATVTKESRNAKVEVELTSLKKLIRVIVPLEILKLAEDNN
ncbi:MAG: UpxY family transcription antiterminator [Bacteroidia bacterium]|nr:UpxY family transcription antiterminator [Bacteroidia bacterium]